MTAEQIIDYLESIHETVSINNIVNFLENPEYSDLWDDEIEEEDIDGIPPTEEILSKLGKFTTTEMDRTGGDYDGASFVVHFEDHGCWIEFSGWYASHHGYEFEDWQEVVPVEKIITVYEKKI